MHRPLFEATQCIWSAPSEPIYQQISSANLKNHFKTSGTVVELFDRKIGHFWPQMQTNLFTCVTNIFKIFEYWAQIFIRTFNRIYSNICLCQICLYEYIRTFVRECVRVWKLVEYSNIYKYLYNHHNMNNATEGNLESTHLTFVFRKPFLDALASLAFKLSVTE